MNAEGHDVCRRVRDIKSFIVMDVLERAGKVEQRTGRCGGMRRFVFAQPFVLVSDVQHPHRQSGGAGC